MGLSALVALHRMLDEAQLEGLTLPIDTLSVAYFWESRSYNAYHWVTLDGETLGPYFNVCDETFITPERVERRDLIVDVSDMFPPSRGRRPRTTM